MITNVVGILDSALNAAEASAYCLGEPGVAVAAGLSGLQALIDIVFGGSDQKADAGSFITQAQLDAGIKEILDAIDQTALAGKLRGYKDEIVRLQDSFDLTTGAVIAGNGFDLGKRYLDVDRDQAWQQYYARQTDPIYGSDSKLKLAITDLATETDAATVYRTAVLHPTLVGMFANYCRLAMLIEYSRVQNRYLDACDAYDAAKTAHDAAAKAKHHKGAAIPPLGDPPPPPPATFEQLVQAPAALLLDHELAQAIPVLQQRVTVLEAFHADLASVPAARLAKTHVQPSGSGYLYVDSQTGYYSVVYPGQAQAGMALDVYRGQLEDAAEQAVCDDPRYAGIAPDGEPAVSTADTAKLRTILDDWQACRTRFAALASPPAVAS